MSLENSKPLIPRTAIFGNPSRTMCEISPDGARLAWIAPRDGVLNIWVAPISDIAAAEPVTNDCNRGIRFYEWARNNTHLLYIQDEGGDENWHVHSVEIATAIDKDLTPLKSIAAQLHGLSAAFPDELIVGLNDRDASWHDLYRINLKTGNSELFFLNDSEFGSLTLDRAYHIRLAEKPLPEGGRVVFRHHDGAFDELFRIPHEDDITTFIVGFDAAGDAYYLIDSLGRDKTALYAVNFESGEKHLLGEHPKADISNLLVHPRTYKAEAYSVTHIRQEWHALDEKVGADLDTLIEALSGEINVPSRTEADDKWIVSSRSAEQPLAYHLYDRNTGEVTKLFSTRPELETYSMRPMQGHIIPSRDGLELVSYLTLPAGEDNSGDSDGDGDGDGNGPQTPVPMVLLVHGGPWARDSYGFNPDHQWLANRGYAVLSVNFRGSTGFGKNFVTAGDLEWGRKMHDDLLDAVAWAVGQGIAQLNKVAIMGGSYGGYATLAGLAFTPEIFACGVDLVGPSNLKTLIDTIPPYWQSFYENFAKRMGDPRTEEGRALLAERSPLNKADQIVKPLLIGQGANDPRVKQAESDQIVGVMQEKGLPVTYLLYPDEGHGFARPENRLSFFAVAEAFLSAHLGGRAEAIGDDFSGAAIEVPEGATHVPGLTDALSTR